MKTCCFLMLFFYASVLRAQLTEWPQGNAMHHGIPLTFVVSDSLLHTDYLNNHQALDDMDSTFRRLFSDSTVSLYRILVTGYSSPDGPYWLNERLARQRANRFSTYLLDRYSQLSERQVVMRTTPEDWQGVAAFAAQAADELMPHRREVIGVVNDTLPPDEKEALLRSRYPQDFQYLLQACMPGLRRVEYTIDYQQTQPVEQPATAAVMVKPDEPQPTAFVEQKKELVEPERCYGMALRTNLLYDVVLIPNIGVELSLGKRWTIGADWFYTWFSSNNRHRYWQGYGGYLTLRKYFTGKQNFTGHHLGVYGLGMTYDVEWGGRGYQAARFGFGGGVEYGYSASLSRCLRLDFTLGVGFQDGEYKEYDPMDGHYVWLATHKRHWWGPTKAEISLKWLMWGKNKRRVKSEQ